MIIRKALKPQSWLTVDVTTDLTQADLEELYAATMPSGTASVALYKFGTPPTMIAQVSSSGTSLPSVELRAGDCVYFDGTNFAKLAPVEFYTPWDNVYVSEQGLI